MATYVPSRIIRTARASSQHRMTMNKILSNDEFLVRLGDLFNSKKNKDHGAIYLTQKRFIPKDQPKQETPTEPTAAEPAGLPDLILVEPGPTLLRASDGRGKDKSRKIKIRTVIQPDALDSFYARYADVCKAGMTLLKPRDRTKRKAKAKKRKAGGAMVAA